MRPATEFALNRRMAPDVYLEVLDIVDSRGSFSPWWFTTNPDLTTQAFLEEVTAPVAADFPALTIS